MDGSQNPPVAETIPDFVRADLADIEEKLSRGLLIVRRLKRLMADQNEADALTYRTSIDSAWASYGEKTVTHKGRGPLVDVMRAGAAKFMEENNRSDVQGNWSVQVVLLTKDKKPVHIPLPERYWKHLKP